MPLRPGDPTRLGAYDVIGRLGQGGMGSVYLARAADQMLVAIKVVRPEYADDPEFRGRFRSEVSRAQQVPPFSTAAVLDADPGHDPPYLVVEYVDGPSLTALIDERGPLTGPALQSVAVGIATALTAIHGAGVIHRDLKPRNVLLPPGSPKVIDFGIAHAVRSSRLTAENQLVGTVGYMAPERFDPRPGSPVEPSADIFSWGAVVTLAGTGHEPFSAPTAMATAARIVSEEPTLDGLHGPLRDLVAEALAKDPADRPTARELLDRLLHTGTEHGATVLLDKPDLRAAVDGVTWRYPVRRRRGRWIGAAAAAVLLIGAGVVPLLKGSEQPRATAAPPPAASSPPPTAEWIGELKQSFGSAQPVHLRLAPEEDQGTIRYPRLGCSGTVRVTSRTSEKIVLVERIDTGTCSPRGDIVLWPTGPDTMLLDYTPSSGRYTARASMTRN